MRDATTTRTTGTDGRRGRTDTITQEVPPQPADREEAVSRLAVETRQATPEEGRAALVVSRLTRAPVSEVLRQNRVVDSAAARAMDEEVDEHLIPGYRILEKVGRGSQGVVYRAVQKCLDRVVALKVVSLRSAAHDSMFRRLQREARAIARLNHRNIVVAYDFGASRGRVFLAMEFVEGTSCDGELARRRRPFRKERALGVIRGAADALECALGEGIVHRDIKPANLLLPRARVPGGAAPPAVKVADLGLSRMGVSDLTLDGTVLGTPGYMAPEQARGEAVDHRADIYSLGATLYHLLTGHRPFGAEEVFAVLVRQLSERLPDPRDLAPDLPAGLVYLLQGMMSRRAETRYPDYARLIEDIDRVAAGEKPRFPVPPARDRSIEVEGQRHPSEPPYCVDMGSRILVFQRDGGALVRLLDLQRRGRTA